MKRKFHIILNALYVEKFQNSQWLILNANLFAALSVKNNTQKVFSKCW